MTVVQPASAIEGVLEINQTCALQTGCLPGDAAGFPVTIDGTAGSSYRLTSDLAVATDVGAIAITAFGDVTIDLNGFHIQGSSACLLGSCPRGTTIGVSGPGFFGFGSNIAVFGGGVSRFSGDCIALGSSARVEPTHVSQCGRNGIWIGQGGSVSNSFVRGDR